MTHPPLIVLWTLGACTPISVDDARLRPSSLEAVTPTTLTATAGNTLSNVATVRVLDQFGDPLPQQIVTFSASAGTVVPATATTDAEGRASVSTWTMPQQIPTGGTVTLTATVQGASVAEQQFIATVTAGAPASIAASAQSAASAPANATVTVAVVVRDQYSNAVSGASVSFAVDAPTNAAVTSSNPAATNAAGIAAATWRLDTVARANTLTATVIGASALTMTFTAMSMALSPSKLVATSATAITGTVNGSASPPPSVRVTDQYNNASVGTTVTFTTGGTSGGRVSGGSCTSTTGCSSASVPSSATGAASLEWTFGSAAGTYTLTVSVAGVSASVAFSATVGSPAECAPASYTIGSSVSASLNTADCSTGGASPAYSDEYSLTVSENQPFGLTVFPSGFTGKIRSEFWGTTGSVTTTGAGSGSAVALYAILNGTSHRFAITADAGVTGAYQLTSSTNPSLSGVCIFRVDLGMSYGWTFGQLGLSATDGCVYASPHNLPGTNRSFRAFRVLVAENSSFTVRMAPHGTALDSYLEVYDITGATTFVTSRNATGTTADELLTVTNAASSPRYYEIIATHALASSSDTAKTAFFAFRICTGTTC